MSSSVEGPKWSDGEFVVSISDYIQKNCKVLKDFFIAHSATNFRFNNIYNCHFTGSPLWDLFGKEVGQFDTEIGMSWFSYTCTPFHRKVLSGAKLQG